MGFARMATTEFKWEIKLSSKQDISTGSAALFPCRQAVAKAKWSEKALQHQSEGSW